MGGIGILKDLVDNVGLRLVFEDVAAEVEGGEGEAHGVGNDFLQESRRVLGQIDFVVWVVGRCQGLDKQGQRGWEKVQKVVIVKNQRILGL